MNKSCLLLLSLFAGAFSFSAPARAQVSANVPVDSHYYDSIDKLSGMGYLDSLPNGARPTAGSRWPDGYWKRKGRQRKSPCRPIWLTNWLP